MITASLDQLERARIALAGLPGAAERAVARAMTEAAKAAKAEAIDVISGRYEVKERDVAARLSVSAARPSALAATLTARSPSMPLHYFPHTPSRSGTGGPGKPHLSVTVRRGETRTVGSSFVARLGVKNRIVTRTGGKTGSGKDALRVLYTTPIAEMLGVAAIASDVEDRAVKVLDERVGVEIDRELRTAP